MNGIERRKQRLFSLAVVTGEYRGAAVRRSIRRSADVNSYGFRERSIGIQSIYTL